MANAENFHAEEATALLEKGEELRAEEKYEEAKEYFEKAAALGDGDAMNYLGLLYFNGNLGEADEWKATRLFERSADAGCGAGAANLARCFQNGWGVAESWDHAVRYYEMARDLGDEDARKFLKKSECLSEALAELLGCIMHGKLLSGDRLWEDYTEDVTEKILYKPWTQTDIDRFLAKEGKSRLDPVKDENGNITENILGALVVKPWKEEYEGALATAKIVAAPFKVFGLLGGNMGLAASGIAKGALAVGVKGVRAAHNALKNAMHMIFTNRGIYYSGKYVPYTAIEDVIVIENEETRMQIENGKKLSTGQLILLQVTEEEDFWEIPLNEHLGLPSLPVAIFLVAAARFYGEYGNFARDLSDEEAMYLSQITLSSLDNECVLDYL